jgi:hypothetical protein
MRDLEWIKKDNEEAIRKHKAEAAVLAGNQAVSPNVHQLSTDVTRKSDTEATVAVHEFMRDTARLMTSLWRYVTISKEGISAEHPLRTQEDVFRMFPEINPRFFDNFNITEFKFRQRNGKQAILMRIR